MSHENQHDTEASAVSDTPTEVGNSSQSLDCPICSFESFEYHSDEGVYRAMFDAEEFEPATAVIGAVSTVAEIDPLDVEPLHSTIDSDALNTLFSDGRRSEGDLHVRFPVDGYGVSLS